METFVSSMTYGLKKILKDWPKFEEDLKIKKKYQMVYEIKQKTSSNRRQAPTEDGLQQKTI